MNRHRPFTTFAVFLLLALAAGAAEEPPAHVQFPLGIQVPREVFDYVFPIALCMVVLGIVSGLAGFFTWVERKVAGHMQHRCGPNRVGLPPIFNLNKWKLFNSTGLGQFIADGIKLLLKEDIVPTQADGLLFRFAPYVTFVGSFPVFAVFAYTVMPSGGPAASTNLNIGLLYVMAVSSLVVIGLLMAGWSSGNKWALFGGLRSAAQIVSYELPVGMAFLSIVMVVGSLNLYDIVEAQKGGLHHWFIFNVKEVGPFGLVAFLIYYTASLAEVNRTPFDIPEAESELVSGYHTEYSGMRWGCFFIAEYANMLAVSFLATTMFLGGWHEPGLWPVLHAMGVTDDVVPSGPLATLIGVAMFAGKGVFLVFVQVWLRWTLPRYRVDQLMYLCWKVLLPFSFANLLAMAVWNAVIGHWGEISAAFFS